MLTYTGKVDTSGGLQSNGADQGCTNLAITPTPQHVTFTEQKPGEPVCLEQVKVVTDPDDQADSERIVAELNMFENQNMDPIPEGGIDINYIIKSKEQADDLSSLDPH